MTRSSWRGSRRSYGPKIDPRPVDPSISVVELIDQTFLSYNAGRLREAAQLFSRKMLEPDVTIGLSLTGALTPAGLGISCLIPLIQSGFVDWIVSTGANLYHDMHFALNYPVHSGSFKFDDTDLRDNDLVRIYDIFFDYEVLLETDAFFRQAITAPEFQKPMSSGVSLPAAATCGAGKGLGAKRRFRLSVARHGVPGFTTSSPGDSSIGMNVAAKALLGNKLSLMFPVMNETAAIVSGES
jgi:deoxyhypusine synthase